MSAWAHVPGLGCYPGRPRRSPGGFGPGCAGHGNLFGVLGDENEPVPLGMAENETRRLPRSISRRPLAEPRCALPGVSSWARRSELAQSSRYRFRATAFAPLQGKADTSRWWWSRAITSGFGLEIRQGLSASPPPARWQVFGVAWAFGKAGWPVTAPTRCRTVMFRPLMYSLLPPRVVAHHQVLPGRGGRFPRPLCRMRGGPGISRHQGVGLPGCRVDHGGWASRLSEGLHLVKS